jgi:flagellar basal body rod protein FlgB
LSVDDFRRQLAQRLEARQSAPPGTIGFDDVSVDVSSPGGGILFHDRNNRSMEQLMSDSARNALFHNLMVELLRKQFAGMEAALQERVT